jgi:hypothetical protein
MSQRETAENAEAKNQEEPPEPVVEIEDLEATATEDVKGGKHIGNVKYNVDT